MSDTITITKAEYERLLERDSDLGWLEAAGVDNWCGIDEAWRMKEEWEAEQAAKEAK